MVALMPPVASPPVLAADPVPVAVEALLDELWARGPLLPNRLDVWAIAHCCAMLASTKVPIINPERITSLLPAKRAGRFPRHEGSAGNRVPRIV